MIKDKNIKVKMNKYHKLFKDIKVESITLPSRRRKLALSVGGQANMHLNVDIGSRLTILLRKI